MTEKKQLYRLDIQVEFYGTYHGAEEEAYHIVRSIGEDRAEFVGMYDENAEQV